MRLSALLLLSFALAGATPALADDVTVLRGASAPPPAAAPAPLVAQTVVVPEVVYVPTYYPAFGFYPGYFFQQNRRSFRQQASATGMPHSHTK